MPEIGDIARGRWIPSHNAKRGVDRCFPCNLAYQKATTLRKLYIKHPR